MAKRLNVDWNSIRVLASSGMTFPEISAKLGVSLHAIKQRSKREGWKIQQLFGGKNKASLAPPHLHQHFQKTSERAALAAFAAFQDKNSSSRAAIASAVQKVALFLEDLPPEDLALRCKQLESVTNSCARVFNWNDPRISSSSFNPDLLALDPHELSLLAHSESERLALQNAKPAIASLIPPQPSVTTVTDCH